MEVGKIYKVTQLIKSHTKPLRTAKIEQVGVFAKETLKLYIFSEFRVSKSTIIQIEEVINNGNT